jgi:hypothetical protein
MILHPPRPDFDPAAIVDLDVRDDLLAGREPLPRITAAARTLDAAGVLHLRTTFRPVPLFSFLGRQGFSHHSEEYAADDWSTWFWRGTPRVAPPPPAGGALATTDEIVDLRLFPPPQPLNWILERIEVDDADFEVLLPFFPSPLVPLLEDVGREVVLVEEADDGVRVRITRPA